MTAASRVSRPQLLRRALWLEVLTVGWNVVEGAIAITAALAVGSIALLGFGADSFVESASGGVMLWRLLAERNATEHERIEHVENRARKLVAGSLVALAIYIAVDSAHALWVQERPGTSVVGIVLTAVSLGVMMWLARAKRRVARELGSRAMAADAVQTTACWWLSLTALAGMSLNLVFDWWWADPAAALGIAAFLVKEAREAWRGEDCCAG